MNNVYVIKNEITVMKNKPYKTVRSLLRQFQARNK